MSSAVLLPRSVTVRVPAKVNLELRVGARRDDGFHDLSTVYMAVGLYDEVSVASAPEWEVTVSGPYADQVPTDDTNLALMAARTMAHDVGVSDPVSIRIHKDIPVAGGMAGGSADAAAALVACDRLWSTGLAREELAELAAALGSDVPFAIAGGIAMGSGRGEQLAPVLARGTFHWVFAVSDTGLPTATVYAECDRLRGDMPAAAPEPSPDMMTALRSGDAEALGRAMANDLQDAAISLQPGLRDVLDAGRQFGALGGIVSGSGPTVAFLTGSSEAALDLCVSLTASGVAAEVKRARAPVHGAQILPGATRV